MNIGGKKFVSTFLTALTLTSSAFAGDREWAVAGKVLTGVAVVSVVDRIVNPPTVVVYQPAPVVVAQPVPTTVVIPQQVIIQPQPVVYVSPMAYYRPVPVVYYRPVPVFYHHHRGCR